MENNYYRLSLKISWLSIIINCALALLQGIAGFFSNSIAILTDAVDSLRDILATIVVILSLYVGSKPPDKTHPFGHGKMEDVGGLVISFLLILIGLSFLKDSVMRFFNPPIVKINYFIIVLMLSISIIKVCLGFVTHRVSLRVQSAIIKADALHHYIDFVTTFIVGCGLFLVSRGARYVYVDSVLGLVISVIILVWAFKMTKEFIDNLIGKKAPESFYESVRKIATSFKFVEGVHDIEIHSYGKNRIISLHIEMDPSLSLQEAHSVANSIENKIYKESLGRCVVHVDLKRGRATLEKKKIEKIIKRITALSKKIKDFHGLEIVATDDSSSLNFHLLLSKKTSVEESHLISHRIASLLKEKFNFSNVNIHIEPYNKED